ncbi:MAG: hypothetical protein MZU79_04610 [Anaerotruncus sp.]|nr:hypothetical protein [Anaerotruncus sp.]
MRLSPLLALFVGLPRPRSAWPRSSPRSGPRRSASARSWGASPPRPASCWQAGEFLSLGPGGQRHRPVRRPISRPSAGSRASPIASSTGLGPALLAAAFSLAVAFTLPVAYGAVQAAQLESRRFAPLRVTCEGEGPRSRPRAA